MDVSPPGHARQSFRRLLSAPCLRLSVRALPETLSAFMRAKVSPPPVLAACLDSCAIVHIMLHSCWSSGYDGHGTGVAASHRVIGHMLTVGTGRNQSNTGVTARIKVGAYHFWDTNTIGPL